MPPHRWDALGTPPGQQHRPGPVDGGQEGGGVEAPIEQHQHARCQQRQQPQCQGGLVTVVGGADRGAEQAAGAGLGQAHQPQRGVAGETHPVADAAHPRAVAVGVGHPERVEAVEGDRAHPGEAGPWGAGLGQRPGDHLEQRLERGRPEPTAQLAQRLVRHRGHRQAGAGQPGAQLGPHPGVADLGEQPEREHEIHPRPRGQLAQPALHGPSLGEHVVDQLEGQVAGQLAEMARGEHPGGDGDRPGDRRRAEGARRGGGAASRGERRVRLRGQRDLWVGGGRS